MATDVKTFDINPTPFFIPPRVGGDREFNGHGPRVEVSATLSVRNSNELWVSLFMHAKETTHDWTEAEGTAEYLVFRDASFTRIVRIVSDVHSFHGYTDTNHATDFLELPAGELVRQFECIGDTSGNEAGIRTGVRAHFNPVTIEVETGDIPGVRTIEVEPTPRFIPSHVAADRDFAGHGPRVEVSAGISLQNQTEIWARIRMQAKETRPNWTEAAGSTNYLLYRHDRPIAQLMTPTYSQASYTDVDHEDDELTLGAGGLVERFICTGDTVGPEAGTRTGVVVRFNPITFREVL
jgi:hypothetical protein